ncbi:SLC13 family permease [Fervidobacterium pennivorans]|uniref:SLC13 family permease n=2 Tax=Bacteria TaxID=2 RepID=UPI0014367F36|nr:SLC13 family permease [Fervidobacterium pennivorans]QIV78207.1 citrate transporter [Fervidobacterium pennivorans subsp. keratinolyticus]
MTGIVLLLYAVAYAYIILLPHISSVTTFLFGLTSVLVVGDFDFSRLSVIVDFNTLFILLGMMTLVSILKENGVFVEISKIILKASRGRVYVTIFFIYIAIFFLSSFLDNVTTILIFIPILFYISDALRIDSKMLLINAVLFSNLGGMTTAIGDPPNIIIYSVSRLSFISFITHLMPVGIALLLVQFIFLGRKLRAEAVNTIFQSSVENDTSQNRKWQYYLLAFVFIVTLMVFHEELGIELGTIIMLGAMSVLFVEGKNFQSVVDEIDWDTLILISGLYLLNFSIEHLNFYRPFVSVLSKINSPYLLVLSVLWSSIFLTGFLSALPVTLMYLVIIKKLVLMGAPNTLYWALAIGVGIGGNLTPIASMCNIVGNNLFKNLKNERLTFLQFTKNMLKPVLLSGIISSVFLLVFSFTGF